MALVSETDHLLEASVGTESLLLPAGRPRGFQAAHDPINHLQDRPVRGPGTRAHAPEEILEAQPVLFLLLRYAPSYPFLPQRGCQGGGRHRHVLEHGVQRGREFFLAPHVKEGHKSFHPHPSCLLLLHFSTAPGIPGEDLLQMRVLRVCERPRIHGNLSVPESLEQVTRVMHGSVPSAGGRCAGSGAHGLGWAGRKGGGRRGEGKGGGEAERGGYKRVEEDRSHSNALTQRKRSARVPTDGFFGPRTLGGIPTQRANNRHTMGTNT